MNEMGVYDVCDALGLRSGSPHGGSRGDQISIACFPTGTPVVTRNGLVDIERIRIGTDVLTADHGFQPVIAVHKRLYKGEMVRARVRGFYHRVFATADHRVFSLDGELAKLAKAFLLQESKLGGTYGGARTVVDGGVRHIGDLKPGDMLRLPRIVPKLTQITIDPVKYATRNSTGTIRKAKIKIPTELDLNEELAHLLGLFVAEGCFDSPQTKSGLPSTARFTFCLGEPSVERCINLVKSLLGLKVGVYDRPECSTTAVCVHDWLFARWLEDAVGRLAYNKRVPSFIMETRPSVVSAFLEGLTAGDGHSYENKPHQRCGSGDSISTVSPTLACQVPILLASLGKVCHTTSRGPRVDHGGTKHQRSYEVKWSKGQTNTVGRIFEDVGWYPIKRINQSFVEDLQVFNLTVANDESYTVGPIAVKNCPLAAARHADADDYNLSCSVSISDDRPSLAKCFSFNCGFKGSFYRMLEEAVRIRGNPPELVAFLQKIAPTERFTLEASLARSRQRHEEVIERSRRPVIQEKDQDVLPESRIARFRTGVPKYALNRGLTIETCKIWTLGYDKQRKRLVFPIRRYDGKLVGLSGRDITGQAETKYHNYAGLDKSRYLFGEHMLESQKPIIICEGQFDAIITWQHLGIVTVATMGEGFSQRHVRKITAFEPPVVYIFPDNDGPGHLAAEKIEYALRGRMLLKLMLPPEGMDPGDLTKEESKAAFAGAISIPTGIRWNDIQT